MTALLGVFSILMDNHNIQLPVERNWKWKAYSMKQLWVFFRHMKEKNTNSNLPDNLCR